MQVLTFGSTCSPRSDQFVRNLNAIEHQDRYLEAAQASTEHQFVNNYQDSPKTEDAAIPLISEIVEVHQKGGFIICGWTCSSPEVLAAIPPDL